MSDTEKTTALPTPEELAICMVDGSAELANGDVKWSELPPRAQGEWIKKAPAYLDLGKGRGNQQPPSVL